MIYVRRRLGGFVGQGRRIGDVLREKPRKGERRCIF